MTSQTREDRPRSLPPQESESAMEQLLDDWRDARLFLSDPSVRSRYAGQYLVVYQGKIVGHGTDQGALRDAFAATLGVHPERLVLIWVHSEETLVG